MLLRKYVAGALKEYFSRSAAPVVGKLSSEIPFRELRGEADYREHLSRFYDASESAWLTPSEIFGDAYAEAIANSLVARNVSGSDTLNIVEIGAGNGTCGASMLRHLSRTHPQLNVFYQTYEPSAFLRKRQREALSQIDGSRWRVSATLPTCARHHYHIVALEVLDNLPHDFVRVKMRGGGEDEMLEARVVDGRITYAPLSDDEAIRACLDAMGKHGLAFFQAQPPTRPKLLSIVDSVVGTFKFKNSVASDLDAYLPTGAYHMMKSICEAMPRHCLTIADFDWLPAKDDEVINAPIVQSHDKDYGSDIFAAPFGQADIMFPTRFEAIAAIHERLQLQYAPEQSSYHRKVLKTSAFMNSFAPPQLLERTETRSGYNPMMEDFINTSFLITKEVGAHV